MGIGGIFEKVEEIGQEIFSYFNAFGRFYIQVQILCRVVVTNVFLDDLFGEVKLKCDTKQVGCEQNCINRFSPINHQKIWEFEFFLVLLCLSVFSVFAAFNKFAYKKWLAKMKKEDSSLSGAMPSVRTAKSMGVQFTTSKGVPIYDIANAQSGGDDIDNGMVLKYDNKPAKYDDTPFSKVSQVGYVIMLILRAIIEYVSLKLELNLGRHQSQNSGFIDSLSLKEMWYCPTNVQGSEQSTLEFFPPANRSLFWTDEINEPCVQQKTYVACWIPFSRMKTWAMYFMYYVLILCFVITILELLMALYHLCTRFGGKTKSQMQYESNAVVQTHKIVYDRRSQRASMHQSIQPDTNSLEKMPLKSDEGNFVVNAGDNNPLTTGLPNIPYDEVAPDFS